MRNKQPNLKTERRDACMNEQISFFEPTPIEKAKKLILDSLAELFRENGLAGLTAQFDELKEKGSAKNYSVTFSGNIIVRIFCGKRVTYLEFPNVGVVKTDSAKDFVKVYIDSVKDIPNYIDKIKLSCQYILDALPKDFSCCSRYMECSDAKTCIYPNKDFALGCFYRKVLHSGKVFFGENRNID